MIWSKKYAISDIQKFYDKTLLTSLDISIDELGDDYIKGSMPVNWKNVQPARILHGGASVAMAESLGSIGSYLIIDHEKFTCVGLEINANHIRSVKENEDTVFGIAKPIHIGSKTHVWEIKMTDSKNRLICISRLTVVILPK